MRVEVPRGAVLWVQRQARAPIAATCGTVVLFCLSLTPSLLPRTALAQALVSAVCAVAGYGVGALVGWLLRSCGLRLEGSRRRTTWRVVAAVGALMCVLTVWRGLVWENEVRDLVGMEHVGVGHSLLAVLSTVALLALFLLLARGLKAAGRAFGRVVARFLPARPATVLGGLVVAVVAYGLAGVAGGRLLGVLDSTFLSINDELRTERSAPTAPELSAGPSSTVAWDDLGRQGRLFVSGAPTAEVIADFSGEAALQPVRAYVGAGPEGVDIRGEAERAVAELEALGGFDRSVLNVVTGTGRGWVNENQAQALEYMWGGDTATVSIQYSYLPSWMSFVLDRRRSQDAGRELFDAVYARWLQLPESDRPLLVVSGESLGSFGGEAAFSGDLDLASRTSGALFVGPTANNELWTRFTEQRDPGTTQVDPVFDQGRIVRFAQTSADWWSAPGPWGDVRIGYLQHANDPITWWSLSLAVERPDWLDEPEGRDVSPRLRWIPGVTMLQLGVDQLMANAVPAGQGHQFGQEPVRAWAEILPPPGWSDQDTDELATVVRRRGATG